jgi:hypothetical protein
MAIVTNPITGVEYDDVSGNSIKKFVAVESNGTVRNPNGGPWPYNEGGVHTQPYDYYELVPFEAAPFDAELFTVDNENSGWGLKPARNQAGEFVAVPDGHPHGTYEYSQAIKRRSMAELKILAKGYADRYNAMLWPQENGYTEKREYAERQVAANNGLPQFIALTERHNALLAASFHNDARLGQLYAEIDAAGEDGAVDFVVGQMATEAFPEGWVNGIPE